MISSYIGMSSHLNPIVILAYAGIQRLLILPLSMGPRIREDDGKRT